MTVLYHDGFHDYMKQVLEMAPTVPNAVILGAAVANLIPMNPWQSASSQATTTRSVTKYQ